MPGDTRHGHGDDPNESISSLPKVASLPWDMKTENSMLRSRLEEQSQLICLLKQRADGTIHRCQGLERINEELERRSKELAEKFEAEQKRADKLDESFNLLADNHQQMIHFKDEYKRQNDELRRECEKLCNNAQPELLEKDRSIHQLNDQLHAMEKVQREQSLRHEKELESMEERLGQLMEKNQGQTIELDSLKLKLTNSQELCCQSQEELLRMVEARRVEQKEAERRISEMTKEKEDLLKLCMDRGKSIQDKQKEISELSDRLQDTEKARQRAEEKFHQDSAAVDTDIRVSELHKKLEESDKELGQLRREFEAYKIHSGNLLSKERELNAKLRHLIG
ncbi:Bc8 orange interacting [Pelobates cultripes]|uniref:Bc8 orange interacting n=1 Tax=Pelobates cultripes TaxID=61616 RepID=A0AAD1R5J2_PELCU|nr:Bc8 orange interacting [Pelobates cultripes]